MHTIPVIKVTDAKGRDFFSDSHTAQELMHRVPGWTKIERLHMTEAQYHAIPATVESAKLLNRG